MTKSRNEGRAVVVSGSIAFDTLMSFPGQFSEHFLPDKLDRISVSFLVDTMKKRKGGCAANIAYSLALLGEKPVLFGAVGGDFVEYGSWLAAKGVDVSGVRVFPDEFTSSFFVSTDRKGNQIASFYTGAMRLADSLKLADMKRGDIGLVVVSPNDPGAMIRIVQECRKLGLATLYDPGQQVVRLDSDSLKQGISGARWFIVNEYEWELVTRKTGWKIADVLKHAEALIVTLGDKGSMVHTHDGDVPIPVVPPEAVVDPTGVGDAFRAGLIAGRLGGLPWEIAGRMGSLAATFVLETDGPQSHSYTPRDFVRRYRKTFGECRPLEKTVGR